MKSSRRLSQIIVAIVLSLVLSPVSPAGKAIAAPAANASDSVTASEPQQKMALKVSTNLSFSCALTVDGEVWCWGLLASFGLGYDDHGPSRVFTTVEDIKDISVGSMVCALDGHGQPWCYGSIGYTPTGAFKNEFDYPYPIDGVKNIVRLSTTSSGMCGIDASGGVWCWGTKYATSPAQVSGLAAPATSVLASNKHNCATLSDGSASCWGENWDGSMGTGYLYGEWPNPTPVLGLAGAADIQGNDSVSCARKKDGHVVCWGYTYLGTMGDGTRNTDFYGSRLAPTALALIESVSDLTLTVYTACAATATNVECWGNTPRMIPGESLSTVPVTIENVSNPISVSAFGHHACAVAGNHAVYCWGTNETYSVSPDVAESQTVYPPVTVPGFAGQTRKVSGTVTTASGDFVPGVKVISENGNRAITNDQGQYELTVPTGRSLITPVSNRYAFFPASIEIVDPDGDVAGQDFTAKLSGFSVLGRVTTSSGAAVQGALVLIDKDHFARTDASGNYALDNLVPGNYRVSVSHTAYYIAPAYQNVQIVDADLKAVDFSGEKRNVPIEDVRVSISREFPSDIAVTGTVFANNTGPSPQSYFVTIKIISSQGQQVGHVKTLDFGVLEPGDFDQNGKTFDYGVLPVGRYQVDMSFCGWVDPCRTLPQFSFSVYDTETQTGLHLENVRALNNGIDETNELADWTASQTVNSLLAGGLDVLTGVVKPFLEGLKVPSDKIDTFGKPLEQLISSAGTFFSDITKTTDQLTQWLRDENIMRRQISFDPDSISVLENQDLMRTRYQTFETYLGNLHLSQKPSRELLLSVRQDADSLLLVNEDYVPVGSVVSAGTLKITGEFLGVESNVAAIMLCLAFIIAAIFPVSLVAVIEVLGNYQAVYDLIGIVVSICMIWNVPAVSTHARIMHGQYLDNWTSELTTLSGSASLFAAQGRTLVYSPDGRLMTTLNSAAETDIPSILHSLGQDKSYAAGVTRLSSNASQMTRTVVLAETAPKISLTTNLFRHRYNTGERGGGSVLLQNRDAGTAHDVYVLFAGTGNKILLSQSVHLEPAEKKTLYLNFTAGANGTYSVRGAVELAGKIVAQSVTAYAVGSGPAISLEPLFESLYYPTGELIVPVTVSNFGDQEGCYTASLETTNLETGNVVSSATLDSCVPAAQTQNRNLIVMSDKTPSTYHSSLVVNGELVSGYDFTVSADDTLWAVLDVSANHLSAGERTTITAYVTNSVNDPTDADVQLSVVGPNGSQNTLTLVRQAVGVYQADFSGALTGTYQVELLVEKDGCRSYNDSSYMIVGSASNLLPVIDRTKGEKGTAAIRAVVLNDSGLPVQDAVVTLDDGQHRFSAVSGPDGLVSFGSNIASFDHLTVTVERPGYNSYITSANVPSLISIPKNVKTFLPSIAK